MKVIKKDIFCPQLCDDASDTPNIDLVVISCSKDNLWSSVTA